MKRNLLIVDDSRSLRRVIRNALDGIPDLVFYEAGDGREAEQVVQERQLFDDPIDLILLDWMLPEVTGYEFLRRLRATEDFRYRPQIIMLTAESLPEHVDACIKYGISAYLTKPFTAREVLDAVSGLLNSFAPYAK